MSEQSLDNPPNHPQSAPKEAAGTVTNLRRPHSLKPAPISFHRTELMAILNIYGRMVAAGEWRDYAIDSLKEKAVFSIFRRTGEMPVYRIEKIPKLARKQGAYLLVSQQGQILKRGQDLSSIIKLLNQKMLKLID